MRRAKAVSKRPSNVLLRRCLDQARHGITIADARLPDIPLVYVNQAFASITGYNPDELIGHNCRILQGEKRDQRTVTLIRKALDSRQPVRVKLRNYRKDGTAYWNDLSITPVFSRSGELTHFIGVQENVSAAHEARAELLYYQKQLRALTHRRIHRDESERQRLACDIHDQLGQTLSACRIKIGALSQTITGTAALQQLTEIRGLVETAIGDTRAILHELSPPLLRELGLVAALNAMAEQLGKRHGVPITVEGEERTKALREETTRMLYRSAWELTTNAGKHAQPSRIQLKLRREDRFIVLEVIDDGNGFIPRSKKKLGSGGFGIFSILEQAGHLGGSLRFTSEPGLGTHAVLRLPFRAGTTAKTRRPRQKKARSK